MGKYLNGINYQNLVLGPGLVISSALDQFGNITIGTTSGAGEASTLLPLSQFASTTSSQLAGVISDETGTGLLVFNTSPTLVTPTLGVATATTLNGQSLNLTNYSTAAQTGITGGTNTYLTNSNIVIPAAGLRVGTIFRWRFNITKTAAGSASGTFTVTLGTTGTTADSAILSFTKPAGTAAIDEGWVEIDVTIRGPLGASCIATGEFRLVHNLAATGHATIPCVVVSTQSSTFSSVFATGQTIGVCTNGGASDSITVQQLTAEAVNL
jgi:hypothetical protein